MENVGCEFFYKTFLSLILFSSFSSFSNLRTMSLNSSLDKNGFLLKFHNVSRMYFVCIMDVSWWMYQCITWRLPPPCALPQHWPAPPSASQELLPMHLKKNEELSTWAMLLISLLYWMYHGCIMLPICLLYWPVSLYSILSMASYLPRTCNKKAMSDKVLLLRKGFWKIF